MTLMKLVVLCLKTKQPVQTATPASAPACRVTRPLLCHGAQQTLVVAITCCPAQGDRAATTLRCSAQLQCCVQTANDPDIQPYTGNEIQTEHLENQACAYCHSSFTCCHAVPTTAAGSAAAGITIPCCPAHSRHLRCSCSAAATLLCAGCI